MFNAPLLKIFALGLGVLAVADDSAWAQGVARKHIECDGKFQENPPSDRIELGVVATIAFDNVEPTLASHIMDRKNCHVFAERHERLADESGRMTPRFHCSN